MRNASAIASLRAQIARIEGQSRHEGGVLPFGLPVLDAKLPGGGLALGALHEVVGGGPGTVDGAAAALFSAGIAARTEGPVFWICTQPDLFAPSLAQAGLPPDRVIYVEAGDDKTVLACTEEALRHGSLGAVVAEVAALNMTASRRLQLAVEGKRTIGIALRRWRRQADAADFGHLRCCHCLGGKSENEVSRLRLYFGNGASGSPRLASHLRWVKSIWVPDIGM